MRPIFISLVLFTILLYPLRVICQEYNLVATIENSDTSFTTDPLGRIYTFSSGNLTRYSPSGVKELEFSIYNRGPVGYIDAIDPLKILIFYPVYGDVSILDAGFSENVTFSLPELGYPLSQLICVSPRSGYWVYDPAKRQLFKINDQLNEITEGTFIDRIEPITSDPVRLSDSGDWVILEVPRLGLLVFDQYGTYFKTIRRPQIISYQVLDRRLLVFDSSGLSRIGIEDGIIERMALPPEHDIKNVRVEEGRLVLNADGKLWIYSFE